MAIDITPNGMWSQPEPQGPTGLAGFFQQPDIGSEIGERLGLIGEILSRTGSGQGLAGIAGQIGAVNERSTKRKTRRQMLQMANRMADKLEGSNPDLAMMIRANPEYGMELAGKMAMAPIEFENEMKLSRAKGADEYKRAIDLAREKAGLEAKAADLKFRRMFPGFDFGGGTAADTSGTEDTSAIVPDTAYDTAQAIPEPIETGGGEYVSPEQGDAGDPGDPTDPNPIGANGVDYGIGLADGADGRFQLYLRKVHKDPNLSVTDAIRIRTAAIEEKGMGDALGDVAKRQEKIAEPARRVAALEAQAKPFAVAPQGPSLPNDPDQVQANYDAVLKQAGVPQDDASPAAREQTAVALRAAKAAGDDSYASLLKSLLTAGSEGGEIILGDGTIIRTGAKGNKPSEYQLKNDAFYQRGKESMPILEDEKVFSALTDRAQASAGAALPDWASSMATSTEYKLGRTAARNFISVLLRGDSGATVTPHEEELYWQIFIPSAGDDENTLNFKKQLRETAVEAIKNNRSEQAVLAEAYSKTNKHEAEVAAQGRGREIPKKVIPPMPQWAIDAEITPEQWADGEKFWFPEDPDKK